MNHGDTIVAISSAVGESARIIVRLSGSRARDIVDKLSGRASGFGGTPTVISLQLRVDALTFAAHAYVFYAPHSYTGEDLVELHLPGNPLLARMTLSACQQAGARLADPGEFTARAYFNGRLDLTEAEGVAATIAAHGEAELAAARQLLAGELSRRLVPIMDLLADTLALVEVGIDFVDEEVTFLPAEELRERLTRADGMLAEIQSTSGRFERLSHEPRVVLVGPPNAGKSTLLNALAGHDRAVVSPIAGTTRDVLSATVFLRRGAIQLIDVAGFDSDSGRTRSDVHSQMQTRAKQAMESADVVVGVQEPGTAEDASITADLRVNTKADLHPHVPGDGIFVSAVTGQGLAELRDRLDELAFGAQSPGASLALTSRHLQAIETARLALARALERGESSEVLAMELRESLDALGQILGVIAPDDLLGRIFSAFCIGK